MNGPRRKRARQCARRVAAEGAANPGDVAGAVADAALDAAARAATVPRPPTLLSLPDKALAKVFALLSARPGMALGYGARHAHALAAAHPRLDRLFRCELVTRLEMCRRVWWSKNTKPLVTSEVQRALQRHPRATALALDGYAELGSSFLPDIDIAACAVPRLTVVELKDMNLAEGGGVPALVARCRGLEELRVDGCVPKMCDAQLNALVSAAGPRLRKLALILELDGVTDAGGARLRDLSALTELELICFYMCRLRTCQAIAALPLLASLGLGAAFLSDEHAAAAFPRMQALRELNVSFNDFVGPRLWAALPPTLRVLRANRTALLAEAPGDVCATALAELYVDQPVAASWAALAGPHVRALRVLSVNMTETLDDAGADAALQAMPHLEDLNLQDCWSAGNGTAAAIARHAALRFVDMRGTEIGPEGVLALRRWEADGTTAAVRGERTTAGRFSHKRNVRM